MFMIAGLLYLSVYGSHSVSYIRLRFAEKNANFGYPWKEKYCHYLMLKCC